MLTRRVIRSMRGVCIGADSEFVYLVRNAHILKYKLDSFQLVVKRKVTGLPFSDCVFRGQRLYSRIFRRGPITGEVGRTTVCFYTRRKFFLLDSSSLAIVKTIDIAGFHPPLNITFDEHAKNEEYVFGEYSANLNRRAVGIFRFSKDGIKKLAEIPENEIEHIHNILLIGRNRYLILTGDFAESPSFWLLDNDQLKKVIGGKQEYRSCVALVTDSKLVYPTDTTTQKNYLYRLDINTGKLEKIAELPASSIYGDARERQLVFATNLEPSLESKFTRRKWITRELPADFSTSKVHIFSYRLQNRPEATVVIGKLDDILQLSPSRLPYRLFQYPSCRIWLRGDNVLLYGMSVKDYDGMTFVIPND